MKRLFYRAVGGAAWCYPLAPVGVTAQPPTANRRKDASQIDTGQLFRREDRRIASYAAIL